MKKIITTLYNQPYLLLILTMLFWGGNIVSSRAIAADFGSVSLAYLRWGIALICLTPFAIKHVRNDWQKIKKHWLILSLLAVSGISIFNTLVYIGVKDTTAINAVLTQSAGPLIVFIWSFILFGEKINIKQLLAIFISLFGVFIIVFKGNLQNVIAFNINVGDVFIVIAIVFYALYSSLLRKKPDIHWLSFLYITFLIGELVLTPFFIWEIMSQGNQMFINLQSVTSLLYIAIFPAILAYIFFNRAVALIGANIAVSFFHLIPVFGTIMAILFLGESLHLYHIIGFTLVILGIYISVKSKKAPK